ncbi:hypothetical protein B484DRAFT_170527 [Ochromonadaceae sp. CCMP2298]|nr:hypothetical protein B484DRAFT_170527 [Ochromonadaceae sp. CCMP2298]
MSLSSHMLLKVAVLLFALCSFAIQCDSFSVLRSGRNSITQPQQQKQANDRKCASDGKPAALGCCFY